MPGESLEITISVTREYGDPDLYVKVGGEMATKDHFDYTSTNVPTSPDSVTIPEGACVSPDGDEGATCQVSIGVFGYTAAAFSLLVSTADVTTTLRDARPFKESAGAGATQCVTPPPTPPPLPTRLSPPHPPRYFQYTQPSAGSVQFIVTPIQGNPSLYASSTVARPNATTCPLCISHDDSLGLSIPHISLPSAPAGNVSYIGVSGSAAEAASFTIRANVRADSATGINTLLNGVAQEDIIASPSTGNSYQMRLPAGHDQLQINLQPQHGAVQVLASTCDDEDGNDCQSSLPSISHNIYLGECSHSLTDIAFDRNDTETTSYVPPPPTHECKTSQRQGRANNLFGARETSAKEASGRGTPTTSRNGAAHQQPSSFALAPLAKSIPLSWCSLARAHQQQQPSSFVLASLALAPLALAPSFLPNQLSAGT
jgi:hypothetical protein